MFTRLALLPLGLFAIWCFLCQRWYVCHIKLACEKQIEEPPPPPPPVDERPLVFRWDAAEAITRPSFPDFKKAKLDGLPADKMLEVVGLYFAGEKTPAGYPNMGLARAAKVKALFCPPLDPKRVVESSRLVDPEPPGLRGDTLFEAAEFNYRGRTDTIEIIVVDNMTKILFPYGSSIHEPDPGVAKYLAKMAQRLSQTTETVSITGHTDDAGTIGFNQGLGLARAKHIQDILVGKGVAAGRVTISSKGETEPVSSNDTEEGSRQNRRVVIVLNKTET